MQSYSLKVSEIHKLKHITFEEVKYQNLQKGSKEEVISIEKCFLERRKTGDGFEDRHQVCVD